MRGTVGALLCEVFTQVCSNFFNSKSFGYSKGHIHSRNGNEERRGVRASFLCTASRVAVSAAGRHSYCSTVWTQSARYCGARFVYTRCIMRHSLYVNVILDSIGNQCSCWSAGVMWSLWRRLRTRAAAFRTRCNGSMLDRGRPASTELQ